MAKTGKGKTTKKVFSVTVDTSLLEKFNEYCDENSINKSDLIEKQIKKYLEERK
jgi:metal-responsive CopG/Arc/MetJ family transcriptional regulator